MMYVSNNFSFHIPKTFFGTALLMKKNRREFCEYNLPWHVAHKPKRIEFHPKRKNCIEKKILLNVINYNMTQAVAEIVSKNIKTAAHSMHRSDFINFVAIIEWEILIKTFLH